MKDSPRLTFRAQLILVFAGMLLFSVATAWMNWAKYVSLRSTWAYDLALFHNMAFNLSRGRRLFYILLPTAFNPADFSGPSLYRCGHFFPLFYLVSFLYRIRPDMGTFFFLQSAGISLGALPLFLFGRERSRDSLLGLLLAGVYLFHPAIGQLAFNDYRNIALGIAPGLFALWFYSRGKPILFAACAVLMLGARAEYTFLLPLFGLMNWPRVSSRKRPVLWLALPVLLACGWALLARIYYRYYFDWTWPMVSASMGRDSIFPFVAEMLRRIPVFLSIGLLPVLIGLLAPECLIVTVPLVAFAHRIFWPGFPHHDLHHLAPALLVVFWAFALGMDRASNWTGQKKGLRKKLQAAVVGITALSFVVFALAASKAYLWGGFPKYPEITAINDSLPPNATIMAPKRLLARFSDHTRIFANGSLPYGPDKLPDAREFRQLMAGILNVCDLVVTDKGEGWLESMVEGSGQYRLSLTLGVYHFYKRKAETLKPPDPDAALQHALRWNEMSGFKKRGL